MTMLRGSDEKKYGGVVASDPPAAKAFACIPPDQRMPKLQSMADAVFKAAAIGSFIVVRDMNSVVELILEDRQNFCNAIADLRTAVDEARSLLEIINSAEHRLTLALAIIDGSSR
jgi:hypothetical protein